MTVRHEITEPRRETGARSPEDEAYSCSTLRVCGASPLAEGSSEQRTAIAAEVFMDNAGQLGCEVSTRMLSSTP